MNSDLAVLIEIAGKNVGELQKTEEFACRFQFFCNFVS